MKTRRNFTSFLALVALAFSLGCNLGNNSESNTPPSPEVLRAQLRQQEESNPLDYLTVRGTMTENRVKVRNAGLFHDAEYETDGYTVYVTVKNSATVARFKDVRITLKYLSKTQTVIDSDEFVQYEYFEPSATADFTLHVYPPEEMAEWNIEITEAKATE